MVSSFPLSLSLFLPLRKMIDQIDISSSYYFENIRTIRKSYIAKLYNDKLNVKCERDELVFWLEIITAPARSCLRLPFVKTSCFQKYYFYLLGPFNRAAINPVDVEIILKCKCGNTGNEANPFCPGPRFFSCFTRATFCLAWVTV